MSYNELKEKIFAEIEKNRAELTALNDDIRSYRTSRYPDCSPQSGKEQSVCVQR